MPYQTQEASVFADDMPQDETRRTPTVGLVAALLLVVLLAGASGLGAAALERQRPKRYVSQAVLLIDQEPALTSRAESSGPRSWKAISNGFAGSVQSNTEIPP